MKEHAPTPWGFIKHPGPRYDISLIRDHFLIGEIKEGGGGHGVAIVFSPPDKDSDDSNAAFIVRAVNAHDKLVEVLKAAHYYHKSRNLGDPSSKLLLEIERALALAEEEK